MACFLFFSLFFRQKKMYFQITLKHLYITCIYSSALNPQHSPHVFCGLGECIWPCPSCLAPWYGPSASCATSVRSWPTLLAGSWTPPALPFLIKRLLNKSLDQKSDPIGQEALSNGRNLARERFGILLEELDDVAWASLLRLLPPRLVQG